MPKPLSGLLEEIEAEVDSELFINVEKNKDFTDLEKDFDVESYKADVEGGWSYLAVSFDIEEQGFPPGTRGYDGTAIKGGGMVMRLPRDLAEKVFKKVSEQHEANT